MTLDEEADDVRRAVGGKDGVVRVIAGKHDSRVCRQPERGNRD